jgi:hypothetical protein
MWQPDLATYHKQHADSEEAICSKSWYGATTLLVPEAADMHPVFIGGCVFVCHIKLVYYF